LPTLEQEEIALLKGRVSKLEARLDFLYRHLGVTFVAETHSGDNPQVIAALQANNMLEAIKLYRMTTNASLEDAKVAIQELRSRLGI